MNKKMLPDRVIYYDYLRVLATIAVIMMHVVAPHWYGADVNGMDWKILNFYNSIARWGVPVFLMISGALFLKRDNIPVKSIYTKYVPRMIVAYFTWGFIYYLFSGESVSQQFLLLFQTKRTERIISIINGHYHLWFVPMIIGIYICMPIIKQITRNEKASTYFLIISCVFWLILPEGEMLVEDFGSEHVIELTDAIYGRVEALSLDFVKNYVFYFVLGYKLSQINFEKKKKIMIYILGAMGFAFTIIVDHIIAIKTQVPIGTYYGNSCVNVMFEAIAVFELLKNMHLKENGFSKWIAYLSKISFGAYLVHALIIEILAKNGLDALPINVAFAIPIEVIAVFAISFAISATIHLIPGLRKYCV